MFRIFLDLVYSYGVVLILQLLIKSNYNWFNTFIILFTVTSLLLSFVKKSP